VRLHRLRFPHLRLLRLHDLTRRLSPYPSPLRSSRQASVPTWWEPCPRSIFPNLTREVGLEDQEGTVRANRAAGRYTERRSVRCIRSAVLAVGLLQVSVRKNRVSVQRTSHRYTRANTSLHASVQTRRRKKGDGETRWQLKLGKSSVSVSVLWRVISAQTHLGLPELGMLKRRTTSRVVGQNNVVADRLDITQCPTFRR